MKMKTYSCPKHFVGMIVLLMLQFAFSLAVAAEPLMVSLTFDDGTADHCTCARELLKAKGFPATFNVITGKIGNGEKVGWKPKYLTWDQVRSLAADGHEIASHSHTHPNFTQISQAEIRREIELSRDAIASNVHRRCRLFCYPYTRPGGKAGEDVGKLVADAGLYEESWGRRAMDAGQAGKYSAKADAMQKLFAEYADKGAKHLPLLIHGVTPDGGGASFFATGEFAAMLDQIEACQKAGQVKVVSYWDAALRGGDPNCVPVPRIASVLYDGQPHEPDLDDAEVVVSELRLAVNAGAYPIVVSLKDAAKHWPDGTFEPRSLEFTIRKAPNRWLVEPKLSKTIWSAGEATAELSLGKPLVGTVMCEPSAEISGEVGDHELMVRTVDDGNSDPLSVTLRYRVTAAIPDRPYDGSLSFAGAETNWIGSDLVLAFTNTTSASLSLSKGAVVRYLAVGGGGGGGCGWYGGSYASGGGGGAGAFDTGTIALTAGEYRILVGAGGSGAKKNWGAGQNGRATVVSNLTEATEYVRAEGGGGGGSSNDTSARLSGKNGGSGGGASYHNAYGTLGAALDSRFGHAGGAASATTGGGGGGAGGAGRTGRAGDGLASDITGEERHYAGGGAPGAIGSQWNAVTVKGGLGGGGASEAKNLRESVARPGQPGTGGGGAGGMHSNNGSGPGADGGSGIVVIRIRTAGI